MSARTHGLGRVGIWAGDFDHLPASEVCRAAVAIEDLGYGTLWFPETTRREAMAQAAILLSATRNMVVAAGMTDVYARDPVTAAAAQRTLDEAFAGRFLLGLWDSHPSLAEDIRGHRFGPPLATMRSYLDALDTAPFGPPGTTASPHRVLAAVCSDMLTLAAEHARGATVLGMPIEYTRTARAVLGNDAMLAVTQMCVLSHDPADTADLARTTAAAALPIRRELLRGLGYENPDALDDRLVDALVAHGSAEGIAHRVQEHFDAGADHVSLHLLTPTPGIVPIRQWEHVATHLLPWLRQRRPHRHPRPSPAPARRRDRPARRPRTTPHRETPPHQRGSFAGYRRCTRRHRPIRRGP